jgi:hypothetical protein
MQEALGMIECGGLVAMIDPRAQTKRFGYVQKNNNSR